MKKRALILFLAACTLAAASSEAAYGYTFKILHAFCRKSGCPDGAGPNGLVMDQNGNLFGTTGAGGGENEGVVFELSPTKAGAYKYIRLYEFCIEKHCSSGFEPMGSLVIDAAGDLYGTTYRGGAGGGGTVYELQPGSGQWAPKALHTFCPQSPCSDGFGPTAGLTYAGAISGSLYDGRSPLYGTTSEGGKSGENDGGAVFELWPDKGEWKEILIHSFCMVDGCPDGRAPYAPLIEDASGNLYGTTNVGGKNDYGDAGLVFALMTEGHRKWSETTLYDFCATQGCYDGLDPTGGVYMDGSGSLFGATPYGGDGLRDGDGVLYKVVPDGTSSQETVLHSFCQQGHCPDGAKPMFAPSGDGQGNLFGTTQTGGEETYYSGGAGVVYEASGSTFKVLHKFCGQANCADGSFPGSGVILDSSGDLFGSAGGGPNGVGIIYELTP